MCQPLQKNRCATLFERQVLYETVQNELSNTMEPRKVCYRFEYDMDYDREIIWAFVQRSGGEISLRKDSILYWVDPAYESLLVCAWPELKREPNHDFI